MRRSITRRQAIIGGAAGCAIGRPARSAPSSLPAQPSLLVAGPVGGRVDRWADVIAAPLGQRLIGNGPLSWENVGGDDGVTGVNQYQARTNPDGATALLLPGEALLAWLVGDPRVRFDAGTWAPLWGGTTPAIVAARTALALGQTLRVALRSVAGPELEALLALDLMGIEAVPVPVSAGMGAVLRRPDIDAVYLRGSVLRAQFASLGVHGFRPAFALTAPGPSPARDPVFPTLPQAQDLFVPARADAQRVAAAYRAVSAAASLEVALVMPAVAPGTVLAWWRRGCDGMDDEGGVRSAAASAMMQQDDAGLMAAQLSSIALDTTAMLTLRGLLADRYHWRPS